MGSADQSSDQQDFSKRVNSKRGSAHSAQIYPALLRCRPESQESSPTPPPPSPAKGGTVISPQAKSGAFDTELGDTFTSTKYKFSISYPKGWQVRNAQRDLRPKVPGSFWFVFGPQVESGRPTHHCECTPHEA
jgi:hypothetical protein